MPCKLLKLLSNFLGRSPKNNDWSPKNNDWSPKNNKKKQVLGRSIYGKYWFFFKILRQTPVMGG
jgi:NADH:ubiquinone oxidoreductase subunit 6 (subunit J)